MFLSKDDLYNLGLSFDDVLLVPKYSSVESRLHPKTDVTIGGVSLSTPIISSPMDTVTGSSMAIELGKIGASGIVHRFMPKELHLKELTSMVRERDRTGVNIPVSLAVGVGKSALYRFREIYSKLSSDIDWIAVDVANGHSSLMRSTISEIISVTDTPIIAGNVATGDGYRFLADLGVSAVRVGIGGGSICKTRLMTGFGIPTLSSVAHCNRERESMSRYVSIIADGGIRYPADLVKSLAAGADAVMAGGIFAGTIETPGDVLNIDGVKMKIYRGMASKEVQDDRKGGLRPGTCAEGVSTYIPVKGKAKYVIEEFSGGLRSAMTYANSLDISDLKSNSNFIKITKAGMDESHAFGTKK